ncbi:MAG TPA: enoyl-CoA hydratase-related protein [Gemmatimonadales bacterium]|nr:enoyl-CoA hydratase-related protein [Gemmatimonadales bacterium]
MAYTTLLFERGEDGIAVATINRPDSLNALNAAVIADLGQLAHDVANDAETRALILTGSGPKAFVAGADIRELAELDGPGGRTVAARGQAAFRALERLGKPVIAAVNGFALGGGSELAMACHIRLAAPHAKFGQPEVKLGLIPGFGGTVRLPRLVGRGRATELLLTGRMITAEEAERIGLVNHVVESEALLEAARTMAASILEMSPVAVDLCLHTIDRAIDATLDEAMTIEAEAFGVASASEDKAEGTAAFLAKRAPQFPGR